MIAETANVQRGHHKVPLRGGFIYIIFCFHRCVWRLHQTSLTEPVPPTQLVK